jgi:hypothetical protein
MKARLWVEVCITALMLVACSINEELRDPEYLRQLNLSGRDVDEIRSLLMTRSDIRQPLWGFYRDKEGRVVAESGGDRPPNIGSFVTLVHRNGKWQIIKIKDGPVMVVQIGGRNA